MQAIRNLLAWAKANERHISTLVYVAGFVSDIFTFVLIPISVANLLFLSYLGLVAVCILGNYILTARGLDTRPGIVWRALSVILPLGALYFIGNLLSGFLIFYTKSSFVFASWPFLLVLALVFIGNEFFRDYRNHLAFQMGLFFFAIYTYSIFALPLFLHALSPLIFIESTIASILVFALFMGILVGISRRGLQGVWYKIAGGVTVVVLVISGSYFSGLIPPIPLTLTEVGIYHSVEHTAAGYEVQVEDQAPVQNPWWHLALSWQPTTIHIQSGESLSAFSAIFAPTDFGTSVVHRWEQYDKSGHTWKTRSEISFPISGGRNGGYRGYSTISNINPGKYRVSIETTSGQVIGRTVFIAEEAPDAPLVHTEVK